MFFCLFFGVGVEVCKIDFYLRLLALQDQAPPNTSTLRILKTALLSYGRAQNSCRVTLWGNNFQQYQTLQDDKTKIKNDFPAGEEERTYVSSYPKHKRGNRESLACRWASYKGKRESFRCDKLARLKMGHYRLFTVCLMGCKQNVCIRFWPQVVCLQTDCSFPGHS